MGDTSHREVELKWGLASEDECDRLLAEFEGELRAPVHQVNHFFDTDDLALDRAHHTFRLRREGERFQVTLKGPSKVSGKLSVRSEVEWDVDATLAEDVLAGRKEPRALLKSGDGERRRLAAGLLTPSEGRALTSIGQFENTRRVVETVLGDAGHAVALEVDATRFEDGSEEFEVELEVPPEGAKALQTSVEAVFARLGLSPVTHKPKAKRFFDRVRHRLGASP